MFDVLAVAGMTVFAVLLLGLTVIVMNRPRPRPRELTAAEEARERWVTTGDDDDFIAWKLAENAEKQLGGDEGKK